MASNPATPQMVLTLLVAVISSGLLPVAGYWVLRRKLIAATYGSISAVTFITAVSYLKSQQVESSGYMVAAMALMESPAIIAAVLLVRMSGVGRDGDNNPSINWKLLGHEAFLNGAVFLLMGAMVVGLMTGKDGYEQTAGFLKVPFKGILCLFLLDMGMLAAKRLGDFKQAGVFLTVFAIVAPITQAIVGIGASVVLGLDRGDALLLTILFGSASYIAVPAAMRLSIPESNPSLYVPMSLGITFPFNIAIGIPLYDTVIQWLI